MIKRGMCEESQGAGVTRSNGGDKDAVQEA
jgi:hypothetical protein